MGSVSPVSWDSTRMNWDRPHVNLVPWGRQLILLGPPLLQDVLVRVLVMEEAPAVTSIYSYVIWIFIIQIKYKINVLILMFENDLSRIIYISFGGRHNIFLTIFRIKGLGSRTCRMFFCQSTGPIIGIREPARKMCTAAKIKKNRLTNKKFMCKNILHRDFSEVKKAWKGSHYFPGKI